MTERHGFCSGSLEQNGVYSNAEKNIGVFVNEYHISRVMLLDRDLNI